MDPKALPEELVGESVTLRRYDMAYLDEMFNAIDESRTHLFPWCEWAKNQTLDDSIQYIAGCKVSWENKAQFDYAIFENETGTLLGNCSAVRFNWKNNKTEIGYWLADKACGKGYATDAVKTLENALFIIGINRIKITCDVENEASANVAKRCGFSHEGILREDTLLEDGTYRSTHIFSKLKSEWKAA